MIAEAFVERKQEGLANANGIPDVDKLVLLEVMCGEVDGSEVEIEFATWCE